jgi:hypothetical protein
MRLILVPLGQASRISDKSVARASTRKFREGAIWSVQTVPPNQELPEGAAVGKARRVRSSTNAGSSGLSGGACLHADQARWQAAEEADDLAPAELTTDQNLSALVNAVDLKDVLGEIKTNCRDVHWSGSLSGAEAIPLSHWALPGAGAVHPILYGTAKPIFVKDQVDQLAHVGSSFL